MRRELLVHEADPRSPERGQYAFVQALIREVAYNTLAKKDRKVRHLAAARFFETLDTEELDLEQVKWVVLMVLSCQPGDSTACERMEELVYDLPVQVPH